MNFTTSLDVWQQENASTVGPGAAGPPREIQFNGDSVVSIVTYSVLFCFSAVGNLSVFLTLVAARYQRRASRVSLFILHLTVADLFVTFVMIPMEIGWHVTVSWKAGDVACRLLMVLRTFGFYLSSLILIAISLDRYLSIAHPISIQSAGRRSRIMILVAWVIGFIASLPQSLIFHAAQHPEFELYVQCVTFGSFPTQAHELAYNLFNMFLLYSIPLIAIVLCYSLILREMDASQNTFEIMADPDPIVGQTGRLDKARLHTLKMTIVIVAVFIVCWTPYFIMHILWWIDKNTAEKVNPKIQRGLFIFAVSNSCVNPVIYGQYFM
ncbi:hypothetical protein CAPTEDRAFT_125249 [Capitella teleta]|uniref:G-protein coupled receptors family 1 profile domain-containing protein n=1 Tax=Capitella teleta TaxID=283909 RepID=R7U4C9_CAPTE|nr:hypothetical protein CAPTEDRAFT_125249 [Capitella teleta]|eukprot:ELU01220.1 hypothetical protein CAPTEDRAFT_125249 [Capitella teleta]